ncbi:MAG: NADH-quinone oxidoreductase subunit J [Acidimicrobiia bacterium]
MEAVVFIIAAAIVLAGGIGVVVRSHPVHCALSLVMTLFGIAVLFIAQDAQFLAAVQVIVYAGAIVVLFLFVIMLLGVDRLEDVRTEPLRGQRPAAVVAGLLALGLVLIAIFAASESPVTGRVSGTAIATPVAAATDESGIAIAPSAENPDPTDTNTRLLAKSLFSDYVLAFEVTSVLLVIAVVGTVILARKPSREAIEEFQTSVP